MIKSVFVRFLNIICSIAIGLCPWVNIWIILCKSISEKNNRLVIYSSVFIIIEFILITFLSVNVGSGMSTPISISIFLLLVTITGACIFAISVLSKKTNKYLPQYCIFGLIGIFSALFFFLTNTINIALAIKDKKYNWLVIPVLLLAFSGIIIADIVDLRLLLPLYFLNISAALLWICIAKKGYGLLTWNTLRPAVVSSSTNHGNTSNDIIEPDLSEKTAHYDKGWIADDTVNMEINILTIEDIINPIPLKNKSEKDTKSLISYIRKLKQQSETDISAIRHNEKVLIAVENYFKEVEQDSVRLVYRKALYLVLEDYSFQDLSLNIYLERINIKQSVS